MIALLVVTVLLAGSIRAQDKAKEKPPILPANWGKLDLSAEQKTKALKMHSDYHEKLDALEMQIKQLRTKHKADMEALLTDEQRKNLAAFNRGELPKEDKKP